MVGVMAGGPSVLAVLLSLAGPPAARVQGSAPGGQSAPPQVEEVRLPTVTAVVLSRGDGRPVAGARLRIAGNPQEIAADAEGRFEWIRPSGPVCVEISAEGFQPIDFCEEMEATPNGPLTYFLEPLGKGAFETVVKGERAQDGSRVALREDEVREVPGTMGDPFRALTLLPGVSTLGMGLPYPVVRGGQPAATGYFIDGVRVPMLFHLLLGPAVVQSDFLEGIDFFTGTPPVRYGQVIGGVVEGRVARPRDQLRVAAYADLLNGAALLEYPSPSTGTSVTLAGRTSYSALLFSLLSRADSDGGPSRETYSLNFWDYQARVEQELGRSRVRLLALGSSDSAGWENEFQAFPMPAESIRLRQVFHRLDLRLRSPLAGGRLELGAAAGADELGGSDRMGSDGEYSVRELRCSARAAWERSFSSRLSFELRGELEHRRGAVFASGNLLSPLPHGRDVGDALRQPSSIGTFAGLAAQLTWRPTSALTITPGARLDSYHLVPGIEHVAADPRLSLRWAITDSLTLKGGAGLYHQPPTVLIPVPVAELALLRYGLQEAVQLSACAEWRGERLEASAEAFFNPLLRTVEVGLGDAIASHSRPGTVADDPAAHGHAYGLELMLRMPLGERGFGWLAYTYTRSRRWEVFPRTNGQGEEIGSAQAWLPFAFEQAHVVNATLSWKLPHGFTVGTSFHFHTGRPESGQLTSTTMRPVEDPSEGTIWRTADRDQVARLPSYARLDLRAAKSWDFEKLELQAYLDVFNVAFSQEVYAYSYGARGGTLAREAVALPLLVPILGLKGSY